LSVCEGIIDVATNALARLACPLLPVSCVTVRIGRLTSVVPDCLRHYFDFLTPGTALEGAALVIEDIPIRARCADCAAGFEIEVLSFS
jgi:hydrogenase nickel incorporation protein HypA/HybF